MQDSPPELSWSERMEREHAERNDPVVRRIDDVMGLETDILTTTQWLLGEWRELVEQSLLMQGPFPEKRYRQILGFLTLLADDPLVGAKDDFTEWFEVSFLLEEAIREATPELQKSRLNLLIQGVLETRQRSLNEFRPRLWKYRFILQGVPAERRDLWPYWELQ